MDADWSELPSDLLITIFTALEIDPRLPRLRRRLQIMARPLRPRNQLSFARLGDNTWTWLTSRTDCLDYNDCFFDDNDGLLYAIRNTGEVHAIDLNGTTPVVNNVCPPYEEELFRTNYIVRAPWGNLLQVWRYFGVGKEVTTDHVTVYKFDPVTQDRALIKDLRGHAMFVSFGTSFLVSVIDFPALTPNCVYLAHDNTKFNELGIHNIQEVAVYNMQDETFADQSTQSSSKNYPSHAVWVQPSW
uniref:KIB1-4 beta-propeller domain-containing protein n=1 Tax=Leersia perrieri TaxID=77586 RepID=A0A0D9V0D5_9ORYZ